MTKLLLPTFLCALVLSVLSQNPAGINIAVDSQFFNNLLTAILPSIIPNLTSIQIPPFNVSYFSISDVKINSVNIDQINVAFNNGAISVSASGLSLDLSLYVEAQLYFGLTIGANTTATSSNTNISVTAVPGYGSNNTLQLDIQSVDVDVNNLKIQIIGILGEVAADIINLVTPYLISDINDSIASSLQTSLQNSINSGMAIFNRDDFLPVRIVPLGFDGQVMSIPTIESNYLSIPFNGTFYDNEIQFADPPITGPCNLPVLNDTSEDVQIFVSEYVFNSAAYGLFEAGYLLLNVTPAMVPSGSPLSLDTTSLSMLFPEMDEIYGGNLPVQFVCENGEVYPTVSLATSGVEGDTTISCSIQVNSSGTWVQALVMNFSVQFGGDVSVSNYTAFVNLTDAEVSDIIVSNSTIPNINTNAMNSKIDALLALVLPSINGKIASGIPIPQIPYTNLDSAEVTLFNCYLQVGATPVFDLDEFNSWILKELLNLE